MTAFWKGRLSKKLAISDDCFLERSPFQRISLFWMAAYWKGRLVKKLALWVAAFWKGRLLGDFFMGWLPFGSKLPFEYYLFRKLPIYQ